MSPQIPLFVFQEGQAETPSRGDWLASNLESGDSVGVDPFLMPVSGPIFL